MRKIRLEAMNLGRRKLALLLFALMGGIAASAVPLHGHYTINQALPTGGTNFNNFNDAVFALDQGVDGPVVFDVVKNSGPYSDQVTIFEVPGASATNTITFNGHGETYEFLSTSDLMKAGIKLDGANYIVFDSLVVKCLARDTASGDVIEYGYGFELVRNSDHNIIRNCTVLNLENTLQPQRTAGIVIHGFEAVGAPQGESQCDSNIVTHNTIVGGYEGIVVDSWDNSGVELKQVFGNQITYNTIRSNQYTSIYVIWTNGTLIEGNDISGVLYQSNYAAIQANEANYNTKILGNKIHDLTMGEGGASGNERNGIDITYCPAPEGMENVIANNIFYNLGINEPFVCLKLSGNSTNGVKVYHNTFSLDAPASLNTKTHNAFLIGDAGITRVDFASNIITMTGDGVGQKMGLSLPTGLKSFTSDYNNFYINNDNAIVGKSAGASYSSATSWNTGTGFDFHSVTINPEYEKVDTGNLLPTSSHLDNYGKYVGINKDILDSTRPNTYPDLGAYEFLSKPCSTPPVAGTTTVAPVASACLATPLLVSLSGNSAGKGQTYQWQISETENGEYKDTGILNIIPPIDITLNKTLYYRCEVTCEGATTYSTPLLVKANGAMPAGTFSINKGLPTGGTNFASFNEALSLLKCGIAGPIVFNVEAGSGPYNEQVIIPAIPGSSAINTVIFNGNGETLTYLAKASLQRAVIKLNGADYFTFDNLKIAAAGDNTAFGYGVQLINDADFNTISNCTITVADTANGGNNHAGIVISASHNNLTNTTSETNFCDNNTFIGNSINGGYYGISLSSAVAPNNVTGNKFINNKVTNFYNYGIYIAGTANTLVEGNDIGRPTRRMVTGRQNIETFYGIYVKNRNTGLVISKNKMHDPAKNNTDGSGAYGIYLDNADGEFNKENIISNNLVYDFLIKGGIHGIYNSGGSDSVKYLHNTIVLNDQGFTGNSATNGIYQSEAKGIVIKNNNIYITRTGAGKKYGFNLRSSNATYDANNNNYYVASPEGNNFIGYLSSDRITLADWKNATGKEANSLSVDPAFTTGSYKPTASALDNKGTFVEITTDLDGVTRNTSTPDVGAYEFEGVLPVNLVSIAATKSAANIIVSFTTATETNSKEFVIERSVDGINFNGVGVLSAKGSGNYSFTDGNAASMAPNNVLYYRLKIVDKDGAYKYSVIVRVNITDNLGSIKLSPNPFVSELYATIAAERNGTATISVKNVSGAVLHIQTIKLVQGTNVAKINNLSQLPKGVYMVTVFSDNNTQTFKIIK